MWAGSVGGRDGEAHGWRWTKGGVGGGGKCSLEVRCVVFAAFFAGDASVATR